MRSSKQQKSYKQALIRIKTSHDQSANIDTSQLLKQTQQYHKNQINYATYADQISDRVFPLKPLQIGFVQSLTLKDDPKFKQIRHLLQKYNEEVAQYNQKSALGLHLKTVVMDSMLKFIRLMLMAPDATAKKRILDVAYYWFKKNLDTSKKDRKSKQELQKEMRDIIISSKLIAPAIVDKQLPSQKRKQALKHYKICARTPYPQLTSPSIQLQSFITHKLGFIPQSTIQPSPKTTQQVRQQKWKARLLFKRPQVQPVEEQVEEQQPLQNGEVGRTDQQVQGPNGQILTGNAQNLQPEANLPLEIGIQDNDELDQPEQEVQEDKKRGKLDPLVKIFLKDRSKRIKTQGEVSADNKFRFKRNKQLQDQRLDQINNKFISRYTDDRSRFKSQVSRKIQSMRAFSIRKAQKNQTSTSLRVQHTINKVRLNETLSSYQSYLHQDPIRQKLNTQTSLSLYSRCRTKTQAPTDWKSFSSVLQENKRVDQKVGYFEEIQSLKEKFAKYKLYTPLDNFRKAIVHPEEKEGQWSQLDNVTRDRIELPRCQMISNPFIKVAKKKKKAKNKK